MEHSMVVKIDGLNIVLIIELVLKLRVRVMLNRVRIVTIVSTAVEVLFAAVLAAISQTAMMIPAIGVAVSMGKSMEYGVIMELNGLNVVLIIKLVLELRVGMVIASVLIGEGSILSIDKSLCSA